MSRWTRNRGGASGDDEPTAGRETAGGRRRRENRGGSGDDLGSMFSAPPAGETPESDRLREPRSADRFVRGRNRITVRELMEQMNAAGEHPDGNRAHQGGPADESPTQAIPTARSRFRPARSNHQPAPPRPEQHRPEPTRPEPPRPDAPTTALPPIPRVEGNDVTQKIPPVSADGPGPDLSDRATTRRAIEESRAQGGQPVGGPVAPEETAAGESSAGNQDAPADNTPTEAVAASAAPTDDDAFTPVAPAPHTASPETVAAAPMERTPDLTKVARSRPRRLAGRTRKQSLSRNATMTGRILVSVACIMALVGTGFVWGYLKSWNGNWRNIIAVDPNDGNIRDKNAQYGDENYLIVGTDTRSGQNGDVGAGTTADAEGARSDTVILVNIPADRSRVVAVSFPRDLQVDQPECQQWDNDNGTYGDPLPAQTEVKLNSVYALGGPQCLVRVITQMSGLNINHFIAMDFYGFEKVVNAVGGVEVCSTQPLYDYELGQILRKPGKQKLTGRRALNYVRARTVSTEGNGDYGRIKRQQLFMSSLLRSTLSGNVLTNPSKLNSIVNTFIDYSYVDNVNTESLLKLAESMQGIEAGRVSFITIPTTGTATDGSNNELPNTEAIDAIFNAIIDDRPLPGEQAERTSSSSSSTSTTTTTAAPTNVSATAQNPGNVEVRVLNGTGRDGIASEVSDQLYGQGFNVQGVADASENRTDTVIRYGTGSQDSAATLAEMFPGASIQLDRTVRSGVEVILGSEFDGTVGTAPSVGTTLSVSSLPPAANTGDLPNDLAITNAGDTTCS
ncbi:LCP family protein [Gordonia sp. VNK1]|uniref:LCP family glycopolymer transferase n=1 Tax=Gordonia oleivorans TaxID=3156618 RepID=UPI0032B4FFC1